MCPTLRPAISAFCRELGSTHQNYEKNDPLLRPHICGPDVSVCRVREEMPKDSGRSIRFFDRRDCRTGDRSSPNSTPDSTPATYATGMKRLSARPHHLGSPYNKENADFIAAQFRSWGYETRLEEIQVLFPTPKTRIVDMTAPEKFYTAD